MGTFEISSSLTVFALTLCTAVTGWGGIATCAPAANGTTLTTLNTGTAPNGCGAVDLSFATFSVTGASRSPTTGGSAPPLPGMDNIAMYSAGDTGASGNTVGPVNALFDGDGVASNWTLAAAGTTQTQAGTINYVTQANTGGAYAGGVDTYPSPANTNLHWAFAGLLLLPTDSIVCTGGCGTNNQQIIITETFCLGATSTTVLTGGCTAANEGTMNATITGVAGSTTGAVTIVYACTFGAGGCVSSTSNQINFVAADQQFTQIAISDAFSITRTTGSGATVTLTNFENQFDEFASAPEPSTFLLLGSALACVAAIRLRKRRNAIFS